MTRGDLGRLRQGRSRGRRRCCDTTVAIVPKEATDHGLIDRFERNAAERQPDQEVAGCVSTRWHSGFGNSLMTKEIVGEQWHQ